MEKIYKFYSLERWFYQHKMKVLAIFVRALIRLIFSADIPYKLQIGKGTIFPHDALGCVFHPDVVIGENSVILHGVTMGGVGGKKGLPVVIDNVFVGAHAQILGPVKIGRKSIIGGGSVVVKDVPENCVVAGVPAKVVRYLNKNGE